jgi:hypothetical protein
VGLFGSSGTGYLLAWFSRYVKCVAFKDVAWFDAANEQQPGWSLLQQALQGKPAATL